MGDWTFLSNYGHVLVCLARNRDARLRDVAGEVGITERAVQKIVRDLQGADFVVVSKHGRCNRYRINKRKALRHALEAHCTVGKLLALVANTARSGQEAESLEAADGESANADRAHAAPRRPADKPAAEATPPEAEPAREEKKNGRKKPAPGDTRQQGNLF
jgi:Mn-dependent DtxR family transcriptional regulator